MATTRNAGSSPRRLFRGVDRIFRLIVSPLLALYLFTGAVNGLRQQSLERSSADIDCDYRASLLEHRFSALQTYRPQRHSLLSEPDSLTPLIDQTLAACARAQSPTTPRLARLKDALLRWERAQRELRADPKRTGPPLD